MDQVDLISRICSHKCHIYMGFFIVHTLQAFDNLSLDFGVQ